MEYHFLGIYASTPQNITFGEVSLVACMLWQLRWVNQANNWVGWEILWQTAGGYWLITGELGTLQFTPEVTVHCNDKRKIYCIFGDFGAFPSAAWIKRNIKPQELLEGMKQPSTTTFYIEEWGRSLKNFPRIMDMQKQARRADVPIMPGLYSLSSTVQIQRARHMDVCSACG